MATIAVQAASAADETRATALAHTLKLPLLECGADASADHALLWVEGDALSLRQTGRGAPGPVAVDFGAAGMRHRRRGGQNELLGRAVGVGKKTPLSVLDATAGLGRDAFVLADLGCQVTLCERNLIIGALLQAGLERAGASADPWLRDVAARMYLEQSDARLIPAEGLCVDVIYLDPMFPARDKRAAVKKEMALVQLLLDEPDAADGAALLEWACAQAVGRVVVKRPLRAQPLAQREPSHCIRGKAVRYDVHVLRAL